jgi:hypothetical protein
MTSSIVDETLEKLSKRVPLPLEMRVQQALGDLKSKSNEKKVSYRFEDGTDVGNMITAVLEDVEVKVELGENLFFTEPPAEMILTQHHEEVYRVTLGTTAPDANNKKRVVFKVNAYKEKNTQAIKVFFYLELANRASR